MKRLSYFALSITTCLLLTTACEKEAADWTYSTDDTMADLAFDDIYNAMSGESNDNNNLRACANLTLSSTTFPITVTADFNGSTGCGDGRVRSGTITAVYTDRWNAAGSKVTITTTDYSVNGYRVEGTNVIENLGQVNGNPTFRSTVTNGKVTTPTGDIITRDAVKEYAWIDGVGTPLDIADDVWQLTGTANGTTRNGNAYTAEITTPVVKANSCNWVQQGVVEIRPAGGGTVRTVDYGPNTCDAIATVTYGTWSANITMN
ncbi:hypothetical protein [Aureispira anguillae]|uniref:Lipoprotein n=1 Tax=Aureispira anguillae TaxID=2864201 RepID=A0A916DXB4_9BACT|nr:hypothetical protein [Aureispira anguillae]BDS14906.1 hypothetical protein AsAng_0056880 [Aureispira anguillae]